MPGDLVFQPTPKQRAFLEATEPELLYSGAFGAGKSRVGCEKILFLAQYYPGNKVLLVRKQFADLRSTTLDTLHRYVLPREHVVAENKTEHWIDVRCNDGKNTSRLQYSGLDRATAIASSEYGAIFVDEGIELEEEDWAMLEGRLRHPVPFHQIFTATNPGPPSHWLHRRFYQESPRDAEGHPIRRVIESNALENPHNPDSYRERLKRFTGLHRERYVLGKWVGYEGLVYPEYNPLVHVRDAFPIPHHWAKYRVIDFGTTNPFCCQWWAQEPEDGTLYRYREIYMTNRRVADHAVDIKRHSEGETYQATLADHDAGDRLELQAHGIHTSAARKDKGSVAYGIQLVGQRLQLRQDLAGEAWPDGKPGIVFFRDAVVEEDPRLEMEAKPNCTEDEIGSYKWAKSTADREKDEPRKVDDHGMDALRYLVLYVDAGQGSPRIVRAGNKRAPRGYTPGDYYKG